MATTVHIPDPLLSAVDRRARKERVSRNRFIVRALERALGERETWTPGFFEAVAANAARDPGAVDEMLHAIRSRRTRKAPPRL